MGDGREEGFLGFERERERDDTIEQLDIIWLYFTTRYLIIIVCAIGFSFLLFLFFPESLLICNFMLFILRRERKQLTFPS